MNPVRPSVRRSRRRSAAATPTSTSRSTRTPRRCATSCRRCRSPSTSKIQRTRENRLPPTLARARRHPRSDPEDGDLIGYIPWGNIGFYDNTAGIGYSDQTPHLGVCDATLEQLNQLQGNDVTIAVVG